MLPDFSHSATHIGVGGQQVVVFLGLPIRESGQLLRDCLEQADNNTNWRCLHVIAEFVH